MYIREFIISLFFLYANKMHLTEIVLCLRYYGSNTDACMCFSHFTTADTYSFDIMYFTLLYWYKYERSFALCSFVIAYVNQIVSVQAHYPVGWQTYILNCLHHSIRTYVTSGLLNSSFINRVMFRYSHPTTIQHSAAHYGIYVLRCIPRRNHHITRHLYSFIHSLFYSVLKRKLSSPKPKHCYHVYNKVRSVIAISSIV